MKSLYVLPLLAFASSCVVKNKVTDDAPVASFNVQVEGVYAIDSTVPHPVVSVCATKYGGEGSVPANVRGTVDCPYTIPRGEVDLRLKVRALNSEGKEAPFTGTVAYRVVPGDITPSYPFRFEEMQNGGLPSPNGTGGLTRAAHLYGEVKVWVEDAPPEYLYDVNGAKLEFTLNDPTRERTYATGTSQTVYFEEPTIAKIQIPDDKPGIGFDNRSSPFVGQFIQIGRNPERGSVILQSCSDPGPDGNPQPFDKQPATLLVTGTDPSGFFVTDITACRIKEILTDANGSKVRVAEPDGYLPGAFGSMFIYNYSYPDGLDEGDLIWTLSGAVQEFTSTTQLTFPAWSIREKVRQLPADQWDKYLKLVKPVEINGRLCGLDNQAVPFLTDSLCGHNRRNLKLESVESGLVKLRNVRFPQTFVNCDKNGDGEVPFYCEGTTAGGSGPWAWQDCDFTTEAPQPDAEEMQCNIDCVIGQGAFANTRCAEGSTYEGFGQYVVELPAPGPAAAGLDPSLPARYSEVPLSTTSQLVALAFAPGAEVAMYCEGDAKFKAGDDTVVAATTDGAVPANKVTYVRLSGTESRVAFIAAGTPAAGAKCYAGYNPQMKINLITKDAVPELNPNCDPNNPDGDLAQLCKETRAASYDVVGHLRHLQPGRPRWAVLPRDLKDVCCHPGPGMSCPKPVPACTQ